jgi:DNA polymerase-1
MSEPIEIRYATPLVKKSKTERQTFKPLHKEVLREALDAAYGPGTPVKFKRVEPGPGVLCFGDLHPQGLLSITPAQMLTAGAARYMLTKAFQLWINRPRLTMRYEVITDPTELLDLGDLLMVDIETKGDLDGPKDQLTILRVAFWDGDPDHPVMVVRQDTFYANTNFFRHYFRSRKWMAHNAKFDLPIICAALGIEMIYPVQDTLILHYAMHPSMTHDLKDVCRITLGVPDWEAGIEQYVGKGKNKDYSKIPDELLDQYVAYDVFYASHLLRALIEECDDLAWNFYCQRLADVNMLQEIESGQGVKVDLEYLAQFKATMEAEAADLLTKLQTITDKPDFNPGSWQQVQRYLASVGVHTPSTDEKHLTALKGEGKAVEFITTLLDYRAVSRGLSNYIRPALANNVDGYLLPSFLGHGTITGRTSSQNPNIQNIPRDKRYKKAYVAPEGYVVLSADYSQIEARVMACLSGDKNLIAKFQPGSPDFFDALMPSFFPEIFPTVEDYLRYEAEECDGDEAEYRAKGKGVTYGLAFGRMARAIGIALEMPQEDAQRLIDNYFKDHPDLFIWREQIQEQAIRGELYSLFGMIFEQDTITDRNEAATERSALSFMPQHHANQIMLLAARKIVDYLRETGYGRVHALVHDACYLYVLEDHAAEVSAKVEELMAQAGREVFGDIVPFVAKSKVGKSWAEA